MTSAGTLGVRRRAQAHEQSAGSRFPAFDGFRAIAAITVLVTHVSFITGANGRGPFGGYLARMDAGVAIFFLISGFLLYRPFVRAHLSSDGRERPELLSYLRRRVLRIFPAYWLVLAVLILGFGGTVGGARQLLQYATLTHIYRGDTYLGPMSGLGGHPLSLSWSLCTELSFYLFLPLYSLLLAGRRSGSSRAPGQGLRRELIGVGALYLGSVAFRVVLFQVILGPSRAGAPVDVHGNLVTWLPNQLDLFALGMLLAVVSVWEQDRGGRFSTLFERRWAPAASWCLALGSFVLVSQGVGLPRMSIVYTAGEQYVRQFLYGATAFFLILPGVFAPAGGGAIRRFLRNPAVQWLGLISYGIYLWQDLIIERVLKGMVLPYFNSSFARVFPTVAVLTVGMAAFSYFVVERPALRLKYGWRGGSAGDDTRAQDPAERRARRWFRTGMGVITAASVAVRIRTLQTVARREPNGFGDPAYYHLQANMLAKGIGFSEPFRYYFLHQRPAIPSASHPPLYSIWLAIPSVLGFGSYDNHKLMSCLAGVLTVLVVGLVGREIAGWRAGLIAAGLTAAYPNLWMIDGILMPEGLFTLTIAITIGCAYRWWRTADVRWAVGLGVAIALAALTRGEAVMLLAILVVPLLWRRPDLGRADKARHFGLTVGAALLVLAPWMVRNATSFHHLVPLSNNSNEVIYYANCPDSYYGPLTGFWSFNCQQQDRLLHGEPPGDESDKALYWRKRGIQYAMDHKGRAVVVVAARIGRIWDVYAPFQNAFFTRTEGRAEWVSDDGLIYYWCLWPFALLGLVALIRKKTLVLPLVVMGVLVTLTGIYAYGAVRFRTPADIALLLLAGAGINSLLRRRVKTETAR